MFIIDNPLRLLLLPSPTPSPRWVQGREVPDSVSRRADKHGYRESTQGEDLNAIRLLSVEGRGPVKCMLPTNYFSVFLGIDTEPTLLRFLGGRGFEGVLVDSGNTDVLSSGDVGCTGKQVRTKEVRSPKPRVSSTPKDPLD